MAAFAHLHSFLRSQHFYFHKPLAGSCVRTHSFPRRRELRVECVGVNLCLAAMSTSTESRLGLGRGEKSNIHSAYALLTPIDMSELEVSVTPAKPHHAWDITAHITAGDADKKMKTLKTNFLHLRKSTFFCTILQTKSPPSGLNDIRVAARDTILLTSLQ